MTSEELNHEVAATIAACRDRILGVGHQQYANGDTQTFETLTPAEILQQAMEEAEDIVVYGVMARIRLQSLIDLMNAPVTHAS